jgi:GMC oxidoreductase
VRITSPDPRESPSIVFNHLTEDEDVRVITAGMKLAKRIGEAMPKEFDVQEIEPAPTATTGCSTTSARTPTPRSISAGVRGWVPMTWRSWIHNSACVVSTGCV